MNCDLLIIGGGAAGLCAAAALSGWPGRILLCERQSRVGKKLLTTGNGRCNLSNTSPDPELYHGAEAFVKALSQRVPQARVMDFFSHLGLMTLCEQGRIYPRTMSAATVLDLLRLSIGQNTQILTDTQVLSLTRTQDGFSAKLQDETLRARRVLAAVGTQAGLSNTPDPAGFLAPFSFKKTPLRPALVPLTSKSPSLKGLKGLRARAGAVLTDGTHPIASSNGEVLFADYGLSGVCIMDLSQRASEILSRGGRPVIQLNLVPEENAPSRWLSARLAAFPDVSLSRMLTGVLPRLLMQSVCRQANLGPDRLCSSLQEEEQDRLLSALTALPFPVDGTLGPDRAQVMAGGISAAEVDPNTMEARNVPGLYLCGELLDVTGPCGGYNLHFAFAGALCATEAIREAT